MTLDQPLRDAHDFGAQQVGVHVRALSAHVGGVELGRLLDALDHDVGLLGDARDALECAVKKTAGGGQDPELAVAQHAAEQWYHE